MTAKAMLPVKAQPLGDDEERAWFAGRIPRRLLAIPFGGPLPSPIHAKGVDLDRELFDEGTDIYGPHRALRQDRERLTDWSHAARPPGPGYGDPSGMMSGHFIGKSILDPDPDEDGWWVDLWLQAGSKRVALIERLAQKGAQLFGSSQPIAPVAKASDGRITVWPYWLQTLSTAPQNTLSVIKPKAALDALTSDPDHFWIGIETSLRALGSSLRAPSDDRAALEAKAGRVLSAANDADLRAAQAAFDEAYAKLRAVLDRQPDYTRHEDITDE